MRIAVTGGTGFVGSHVVEALLADGHEIQCLVLAGEGQGWLDRVPVRFFEGDLRDPATLVPFLCGCDAIVHIAGLTRAKTEAEFQAVNVGGTAGLIDAALSLPAPPRHVVAISSIAAVGSAEPGSAIDEDAPPRPLTAYGRSKAAMEGVLRQYAGRIEHTIIRAPMVYGPRDRDVLQYFRLLDRGFRLIVGRRNVLSIVYVKTLARAIAACVLNPAAYSQALFIADEGAYDWDQFSAMIEKALGRTTLRVRVPDSVMAAVAWASDLTKPLARTPPLITRDKLAEMRQPCWVVSTSRAKRLIGFEPLMPAEAALAETAAWYQSAGWISGRRNPVVEVSLPATSSDK